MDTDYFLVRLSNSKVSNKVEYYSDTCLSVNCRADSIGSVRILAGGSLNNAILRTFTGRGYFYQTCLQKLKRRREQLCNQGLIYMLSAANRNEVEPGIVKSRQPIVEQKSRMYDPNFVPFMSTGFFSEFGRVNYFAHIGPEPYGPTQTFYSHSTTNETYLGKYGIINQVIRKMFNAYNSVIKIR